jgi:hypothetical protein
MNRNEIPVVLFFFKRIEKTLEILNRISIVKPARLYLISDGGRNENEQIIVAECRRRIEENINWECEVIRDYSDENKGVFDRIGLGAKRVFSHEKAAIFLEDDNLPELTFFRFCEEMLIKYYDDNRILSICGTNYIKTYTPFNQCSYLFSKHMMPCGWASWSHKFLKYYDEKLLLFKDKHIRDQLKYKYMSYSLYKQDLRNVGDEYRRMELWNKPRSWDYQMVFSQRINGMYSIVPKYNQIKNIGVDAESTHGGHSLNIEMTKRFCELETRELEFPLRHPIIVTDDISFDRKINKIILYPLKDRIIVSIGSIFKFLLGINDNDPLFSTIKNKLKAINWSK